ncbi:hypothetical protein FB567DRAFT_258419 [Paraphoma chrysanthemicola]|uniref:F-box domain-containing protein n=1 Tax=Paraphoma chrysanthemicola TaxID=798071 RepID=A0A8K0QS99_9PLEO|nr:hypothetical protein FB567DRAFT_258419 [Paraphoma chrysanthemicola]
MHSSAHSAMAPTILNLLDQCIPIQDTILQHLEIGDVISLAKSTKALRHLVKVVESTQFNINHVLEPFFDAIAFRSLQAQHNVLIASIFAYTFLSRRSLSSIGKVNTLNCLTVQKREHAEALHDFLTPAGYREEERDEESDDRTSIEYSREDNLYVRVYATTLCPLVSTLDEPLTHLACCITWNKAYGLFAYATYIEKQSYLLMHVEELKNGYLKFAKDSIAIRPCSLADYSPNAVTHNSKARLRGSRRVGDERSWIISLNTNNVARSLCTDDVIEYAEFAMSVEPTTFGHYHLEYIVIRSPALRHEYSLPTSSSSHEQKRIDDLAILGMYSLSPKHQPENIAEVFRRRGRGGWSKADMEAVTDWEPPKKRWMGLS